MLQRINKTVRALIQLKNGYMWVILRHNLDCTNKWSSNESVICSIYKSNECFDEDMIEKLMFDNYKDFKTFKDLIKKNESTNKISIKKSPRTI